MRLPRASPLRKSSPTRAMTRSCSMSRNCSRSSAASSTVPRARVGWAHDAEKCEAVFGQHHALCEGMNMQARPNRELAASGAIGASGQARVDLLVVSQMVEPGARVLDVGCGDGELLKILTETKNVDGRGIEISRAGVNLCVAKGVAVFQGES